MMNLKFLSWQEGKYSDLWIFVHFVSGAVGGSIIYLLGISTEWAFILAFTFAICWEIFEYTVGVRERVENRIIDIFVGVFGTFFSFKLLPLWGFANSVTTILIFEAILLVILSGFGWPNYKKYNK